MDPYCITADQIRQFDIDGAILLKNVFNQTWIDMIEKGISTVTSSPSHLGETIVAREGTGAYFNDLDNWRRIPEFQDFISNSPAAEAIGTLIQAKKVTFFHEHVLTKEPGALSETPWHQDQPYYPVDGRVISIWMPIDPVPIETTIQFIGGSHRWNKWFYPRKFATSNNYPVDNCSLLSLKEWETLPDIAGNLDNYEVLKWAVQPGDCIVFDGLTIHGAPANHLSQQRRVLSTRWLGDDAVLARRPWKTSPPSMTTHAKNMKPGDEFNNSTEFPLLWQQLATK